MIFTTAKIILIANIFNTFLNYYMFLNRFIFVRNDAKFLKSKFIYFANDKGKVAEKVSCMSILVLKHIFFIVYLTYVTQN